MSLRQEGWQAVITVVGECWAKDLQASHLVSQCLQQVILLLLQLLQTSCHHTDWQRQHINLLLLLLF
jgi:hypothetical protein